MNKFVDTINRCKYNQPKIKFMIPRLSIVFKDFVDSWLHFDLFFLLIYPTSCTKLNLLHKVLYVKL